MTPLLLLASRPEPVVWRYFDEVRAISRHEGELFADTSGGRLVRRNGSWQVASDRSFGAAGTRAPEALVAPPSGSVGTHLTATTPDGRVRSFWGDTHLWRQEGQAWRRWITRPPAPGDYALFAEDERLLAGTPNGLFAFAGGKWRREALPHGLPLARPHGLARVLSKWVVGGLQGLWIGRPGAWKGVDTTPVRQVLGDGKAVWVLFGNGALDKLEPALDRRHPDVLHGAAKRPWGSCLALGAGGLLIGGDGGWIEKRGDALVERYPKELKGQVVTALAAAGSRRFVGTQKGGLFVFDGPKVWVANPGSGLRDPWVTALLFRGNGVNVATATAGLFRLRNGRVEQMAGPTMRPRHLANQGRSLVVGGMDGAWRQERGGWEALVRAEEVTALTTDATVTASGVYFSRGPIAPR